MDAVIILFNKSFKILFFFQLSEATADLTEERSAFNITNERLETEVADRKKLMKEVKAQEDKIKYFQDYSDKLEMDLITAKTDLNG